MDEATAEAIAILERLIAFASLSARPNLDLIGYVKAYLETQGLEVRLSHDAARERANLHAVVGPPVDGGVALNGHTDVVPVDGQAWSSDPFRLVAQDGRLYGRGTADMKGFLACMLAAVPTLRRKALKRPVHVTMCYDEEIGGLGAPVLVAEMLASGPRPAVAIIGEPTAMGIVAGHKGGYEMRTEVRGLAAHASAPEKGLSAISYAARLIGGLDAMAARLRAAPRAGSPFDPPYSTISVGTVAGGTARNVVAGACSFEWELRPLPGEDGAALIAEARRFALEDTLAEMRRAAPDAAVEVTTEAVVPALDPDEAAAAVALLGQITGGYDTRVVSFGTDAGHFCNAGISAAVFGPGDIAQTHKPDEFIEVSQIGACLAFLDRLGEHLAR